MIAVEFCKYIMTTLFIQPPSYYDQNEPIVKNTVLYNTSWIQPCTLSLWPGINGKELVRLIGFHCTYNSNYSRLIVSYVATLQYNPLSPRNDQYQ